MVVVMVTVSAIMGTVMTLFPAEPVMGTAAAAATAAAASRILMGSRHSHIVLKASHLMRKTYRYRYGCASLVGFSSLQIQVCLVAFSLRMKICAKLENVVCKF